MNLLHSKIWAQARMLQPVLHPDAEDPENSSSTCKVSISFWDSQFRKCYFYENGNYAEIWSFHSNYLFIYCIWNLPSICKQSEYLPKMKGGGKKTCMSLTWKVMRIATLELEGLEKSHHINLPWLWMAKTQGLSFLSGVRKI